MFDTEGSAHAAPLEFVTLALGWDPAPGRYESGNTIADIDLNAAAFLFTGQSLVDVVFHEQLTSKDGAVRHLGDSTTGEGDGDNEVIVADLGRLPSDITSIVYLVTSYTGQPFDLIDNAFCRLIDNVSRTELVRIDLGHHSQTGFVPGAVRRGEGRWAVQPIGQAIPARHPSEAVPYLTQLVG